MQPKQKKTTDQKWKGTAAQLLELKIALTMRLKFRNPHVEIAETKDVKLLYSAFGFQASAFGFYFPYTFFSNASLIFATGAV
jgi:hypothetical protein